MNCAKYSRFFSRNKRFISILNPVNQQINLNPELDFDYLCQESNVKDISNNIKKRKGVGDVFKLLKINSELKQLTESSPNFKSLEDKFVNEAKKLPNRTHPDVYNYEEPKVVHLLGSPKSFQFKPREFHEITKKLNLVRTEQLGNLAGSRSYVFMGEMAELEQALVNFTIHKLLKNNYKIISVPDMLHRDIIESCGMNTEGDRMQVYSLDSELHDSNTCLSGTSEMAIGGYFANKCIPGEKLPMKIAAVSRCYRAEVSNIAEEKGIFRVHQFTKVELFIAAKPESSDSLLQEIVKFQEEHFSSLGLHLRTLDMPPHELGAPAYRKYDIEAWLPGKESFGEISSASNCTDYQSRRLGIKYSQDGSKNFAHTLNGTACAVPRMLIAILETYQNDNGTISIPTLLQSYMQNKTTIGRQKSVPDLRLIKNKR